MNSSATGVKSRFGSIGDSGEDQWRQDDVAVRAHQQRVPVGRGARDRDAADRAGRARHVLRQKALAEHGLEMLGEQAEVFARADRRRWEGSRAPAAPANRRSMFVRRRGAKAASAAAAATNERRVIMTLLSLLYAGFGCFRRLHPFEPVLGLDRCGSRMRTTVRLYQAIGSTASAARLKPSRRVRARRSRPARCWGKVRTSMGPGSVLTHLYTACIQPSWAAARAAGVGGSE